MAKPYLKPLSRRIQISFDRLDLYLVLGIVGALSCAFVLGFWVATLLMGSPA